MTAPPLARAGARDDERAPPVAERGATQDRETDRGKTRRQRHRQRVDPHSALPQLDTSGSRQGWGWV